MSYFLDAEEILKVAIEIEKRGEEFYLGFAGRTRDEKLKDLFGALALEEVKHERAFKEMLKTAAAKKTLKIELEDEKEAEYLKSVGGMLLFPKKTEESDTFLKIHDPESAVRFALGMERDSVLLYEGLLDVTKDAADRAVYEKIISEEKSHIVRLTAFLSGKSF
jgi:rubrerythrin